MPDQNPPAGVPPVNQTVSIATKAPIVLFGAAFVVLLIVYAFFFPWECVNFNFKIQDLAAMLAPLALAASVVERSVEILLSPWRDETASKLEKALAAAPPEQKQAISDKLDEYRAKTQKIAFFVSVFVSSCVAISGVRALQPFLDAAKFKSLSAGQHTFFLMVDLGLSTAMLAGGADAVHSVFTAVTSVMDATATKSTASANKATMQN